MFDQIVDDRNLWDAYLKTQCGSAKKKVDAIRFYFDSHYQIARLKHLLISGKYQPSPYIKFFVTEPKERLIYAPFYNDKVVQHAINNVVAPYLKERYIEDSYACIKDKGNRKAVQALHRHMQQANRTYGGQAYIVKLDIVKFFYRISRPVLKVIIRSTFNCQRLNALLCLIVDHSPGHIGLPLGNLTSQLLANLYLNEIDQYSKHTLGITHYLRYADDIFIMVANQTQARTLLTHYHHWVPKRLYLSLHTGKSYTRPLSVGMPGLGYYLYITHIRLLGSFKRKVRRYIRRIGKLSLTPYQRRRVIQRINAWVNVMTLASHHRFIYQLLREFVYVVFDWHTHRFTLRKTT